MSMMREKRWSDEETFKVRESCTEKSECGGQRQAGRISLSGSCSHTQALARVAEVEVLGVLTTTLPPTFSLHGK